MLCDAYVLTRALSLPKDGMHARHVCVTPVLPNEKRCVCFAFALPSLAHLWVRLCGFVSACMLGVEQEVCMSFSALPLEHICMRDAASVLYVCASLAGGGGCSSCGWGLLAAGCQLAVSSCSLAGQRHDRHHD